MEPAVVESKNPQHDIDKVSEKSGTMAVQSKPARAKGFSLAFSFPHIMHKCAEDNRTMVTVDFLVIGMNKKAHRPQVEPNSDGKILQLSFSLPGHFTDPDRVVAAGQVFDDAFTEDNEKATSFAKVSAEITNALDNGEDARTVPQEGPLPVTAENDLKHWDLLVFKNMDAEFNTDMDGIQQMFFVLTITLKGAKVCCSWIAEAWIF